ncbi:MAG: FAD binding domain-containing protein [Woeseiaceae bacterium]
MASSYERPVDLEHALQLLAQGSQRVLAGGTDVYPSLGDHGVLGRTLDVTAIPGLRGITDAGDHWRIGATSTWSDLLSAELPSSFDCLKLAGREVGGIQIQNAGTIAGNLCNASPAADGVPPLLALDARVELASIRGRRELALEAFITGPRQTELAADELLTAVLIPKSSAQGVSSFLKLGSRKYLVISIAMVAVVLEPASDRTVNNLSVSVGSCSAVACRLRELEADLQGRSLENLAESPIASRFFAPLSPIDDIRASARYRLDAAAELVRRAILDCAEALL